MNSYKRVGDWLVEKGILTPAQLESVLQQRQSSPMRFGEMVVHLGYASEDDVTQCLAEQYAMRVIDPTGLDVQPEALKLIPSAVALSRLVLPYAVRELVVRCVISDPLDVDATDEIRRKAGRPLEVVLASPTRLKQKIVDAYKLAYSEVPPESTEKPKRKRKTDPMIDRFALLEELQAAQGAMGWA